MHSKTQSSMAKESKNIQTQQILTYDIWTAMLSKQTQPQDVCTIISEASKLR